MKIVHFSGGTLGGGAAQGAFRLHRALREKGADSIFYIQEGQSDDTHLMPIANSKLNKLKSSGLAALDQSFLKPYRERPDAYFSPSLVGFGIEHISAVQDADLVHLHWTCNAMLSVGQIGRLRKPVVWTMRDMWPFTGGCHYAYDCARYIGQCGQCPQLGSNNTSDLSRFVLRRKKKKYRDNIHMVAISRWLAEAARDSSVFAGREIAVIPNSVDVNRYFPVEQTAARMVLGIPTEKTVIVFGALAATSDRRKGAEYLLQIAERINREDVFFLVFGASGDESLSHAAAGRIRFLGMLHDDLSLNLAYAAGDVFIAPSLQEAFGKTVIEAMASGTPVVAFETIGAADVIDHRIDGYLASHGSAEDLIAGIDWATRDNGHKAALRRAVREKAVNRVSDHVIAGKYLDLYRTVLDKGRLC